MNSPSPPIRIMVVDDSAIIRGMITRMLEAEPGMQVVTSAANGAMAIDLLSRHAIDVITLDVEMPELDGLSALPLLLSTAPQVRVIMVSSTTGAGAETSLKALTLGAADCVAKPSARRDAGAMEQFGKELVQKIRTLGDSLHAARPSPALSGLAATSTPAPALPAPAIGGLHTPSPLLIASPTPIVPTASAITAPLPAHVPLALAIASSTGGPQALITLFQDIKNQLKTIPVFITQHMPPTFTAIMAEHLTRAGDRPCAEAHEGEIVEAGRTYIAPGDYHMLAARDGMRVTLHLNQNPPVNFCRPSADPMLESLVEIYRNRLLVLVLTGMGHDGLEGARKARSAGATVVAQDEASSVVWGMPRAVAEQGVAHTILPIGEMGAYLRRAFGVKAGAV